MLINFKNSKVDFLILEEYLLSKTILPVKELHQFLLIKFVYISQSSRSAFITKLVNIGFFTRNRNGKSTDLIINHDNINYFMGFYKLYYKKDR